MEYPLLGSADKEGRVGFIVELGGASIRDEVGEHVGCDHTSTKASDPIRTPKLSVLGRE